MASYALSPIVNPGVNLIDPQSHYHGRGARCRARPRTDPGVRDYRTGLFGTARFALSTNSTKTPTGSGRLQTPR
jgi:hypothetical protein